MDLKSDLKGKVAVVTGGSGVLCSCLAKALAKQGVKVAVLGRTLEKLVQVANEINNDNGEAIAIACDVTNKASVIEAKKVVNKSLGRCDILINGAGGNHPDGNTTKEIYETGDLESKDEGIHTFFDIKPENFGYVFDLNLIGTLLPTQVFMPDMLGNDEATVINMSSMSAYCPMTKVGAYSAAKAAISNYTQWLAVHFAKEGVRVNAIAPGFFETEQNKALLRNPDGSPTHRANKILTHTPMERFGVPEDLVGTLLWLCSKKESGFVTGIVVPVDGGFQAYSGV